MTVPVVRQRAKAPKVRTGCKTCRARHLKCDEEKPNCARCRKSGRYCAGYDPPRGEVQARSLAFVRPKSTSPSTLLSVTIPSPSGSIMEMDSAQRRAFDFFRFHTIHQLPGNATLLSWERLALRAGVNDPAVLHAVIALGSLHKSSSSDFQDLELQDFALDQCNKAMTLAREQIAAIGPESPDTSVEVVMLLSLLLWCFEIWCGQDVRANLHFQLGLQILYERVKNRHRVKAPGSKRTVRLQLNPQDDMDVLLQTFVRLDLDMCIPGRNAPYLLPVVSEELPSFFLSLENALVYLDGLTASLNEVTHRLHDRALAELRDEGTGCLDRKHAERLAAVRLRSVDLTSDPILAAAYQENKDTVRGWMKAFTSVEMTAENESAHMLAQIQAFGLWFEVSCLRHPDEMACDRWQEQFDYILSVAERYVRCQGNTSNAESPNSPGKRNPDGTRPGFTLGTALVNVVVIIAWKCRNSATRRRTMRLLRKINLAGVFDGDWLCALTSHVIEMEETSAAQLNPDFSIAEYQNHEIPLEARILDIDFLDWAMPEFYKHEVGKVVYAYQDQNGTVQVDMTSFRVRRTDITSSLESSCSSSDTSPVDLEALDVTRLEYAESALLDDLSTWPASRTYCNDVVLDAI